MGSQNGFDPEANGSKKSDSFPHCSRAAEIRGHQLLLPLGCAGCLVGTKNTDRRTDGQTGGQQERKKERIKQASKQSSKQASKEGRKEAKKETVSSQGPSF